MVGDLLFDLFKRVGILKGSGDQVYLLSHLVHLHRNYDFYLLLEVYAVVVSSELLLGGCLLRQYFGFGVVQPVTLII